MKGNRVVIASVVLLFAIAGGATLWLARRQDTRVAKVPPSPSTSITASILKTFRLDETDENRFSTRSLFSNESQALHLETVPDIDADSAETLIEDGIMGIQALYANALSAYPENLSRELDTPAQFRPEFVSRVINGVTYRYFLLYATDRFTYGAASKDTARLRSLVGWIYCEERSSLYKVRIFAPLDTPPGTLEDFFTKLPCGR